MLSESASDESPERLSNPVAERAAGPVTPHGSLPPDNTASRVFRSGPEPIVISLSLNPASGFIDLVRATRNLLLGDLMCQCSRVSVFRHSLLPNALPAVTTPL